jgi:hypothetical protein
VNQLEEIRTGMVPQGQPRFLLAYVVDGIAAQSEELRRIAATDSPYTFNERYLGETGRSSDSN